MREMDRPLGAPNNIAAERDAKIHQILNNIPGISKEFIDAQRQKLQQACGNAPSTGKESEQIRMERNH